jgi:hypothetical protein
MKKLFIAFSLIGLIACQGIPQKAVAFNDQMRAAALIGFDAAAEYAQDTTDPQKRQHRLEQIAKARAAYVLASTALSAILTAASTPASAPAP